MDERSGNILHILVRFVTLAKMEFDINKYLGLWYQLFCYPSYFQDSLTYNTTAYYALTDGDLTITNSTFVDDREVSIHGVGKIYPSPFYAIPPISVSFGDPNYQGQQYKTDSINYIIDKIWVTKGKYSLAVVTNLDKTSLFVLSRTKKLSKTVYSELTKYLRENYNVERMVPTVQL